MSLKSQRLAQEAYARIEARRQRPESQAYRSFAREFPTLVHQCGLAQAVAFAQAKKEHQGDYVDDLAKVLTAVGHAGVANVEALAGQTRALPVSGYVRLSRDALDAAVWLKRYVEALFEDRNEDKKQEGGR
jgi:CRISPR-associated protein Cmr5